MSPERMMGLAYWASGGDVVGRGGALPINRAVDLLRWLADEAALLCVTGDSTAGSLLASLALELGAAIARAVVWRRAAGVFDPSSLRV
jgi:hypothetical protein